MPAPSQQSPVTPGPYAGDAVPHAQPPQVWPTRQQWTLIGTILAIAAGSVLYRWLGWHDLTHTSAMFVGLPALLAILLALTPKAKSATGAIIRGMALFLLIVAPLLGEGAICILIASPIFFAVGAMVGAAVDASRRRSPQRRGTTLSCTVLLLLPLSLEGVVPGFTADREQRVEVTRVVAAPAAAVEARLAAAPDVSLPIPALARLFPHPIASAGQGLRAGDLRVVRFSGAEGMGPGDVVFRVAETGPGYLRFEAVEDHTKLGRWLHWQGAEVRWQAVDATHTRVSWTIEFTRELDPAWYFGPWERGMVHVAAAYLIDANAGPGPQRGPA